MDVRTPDTSETDPFAYFEFRREVRTQKLECSVLLQLRKGKQRVQKVQFDLWELSKLIGEGWKFSDCADD